MTISQLKGRKKTVITAGLFAMLTLSLSVVGCSVAQLQAGLEAPSKSVILAAEKQVATTDYPAAIREYTRFDVSVAKNVSLAVYTRENVNASANVLMLHGAGGGAWVWEYYFEHLPAQYNLYALSWRGHFDSSSVTDANANDYVADQEVVLATIAARNKLPIHIIGHSYGAATGVLQIAQSAQEIKSVVLLAPVVPLDYTFAQRLIVPAIAPYFIRKSSKKGNDVNGTYGGMFVSKGRMRRYHNLYAGQDYSTEKPGLIAGDGVSAKWQIRLFDAYTKLGNRNVTVSIFVARYDNVVVPLRQRKTARRIGAQLIEINTGHYLPLDTRATEIVAMVAGILD